MTGRTAAGRGSERATRGGRGRGRPSPRKPQVKPSGTVSKKFQGNCDKLQGCIFDCSHSKQADTFVTTLKRISEHVGSEYKHGGDIRSSILNEARTNIPVPAAPTITDPTNVTSLEAVANMIFKGKIDAYIKRDAVLDDNIQKAYSLVLGQCTDLLQSKLKQQNAWAAIALAQDVIELIKLIKSITFKFEDQKFLPLALHQAKANVYNLRQGNMTNHDYLQRFNNLVDIATTYNGELHDQAIVDIMVQRLHPGSNFSALDIDERIAIDRAASDMNLATMFIHQSDRRRYGKLSEELENAFTKGNDDYPDNLVSAYHLLNEYKNWQPRSTIPDPTGVAFAQKGGKKNNKSDKDSEEWKKNAKCHNCGETGHIRPECPNKEDDTEDADATPAKKKSILKKKTTEKKKQAVTFTTNGESEEEDENESQFLNYGFCTTTSNGMKLRNMILLDNQSTVDLFCNKSLVTHMWQDDHSMTVKGNGGTLSTNTKAYLKNYGNVWFDKRAITNILSLKNVREKFRVTYDSDGTNAFIVHKPSGDKLRFDMHEDGLYYHDPSNHQITLVNTVKETEEGFSKRQIEQAKAAREFQAVVGNPSTHDLKAIISSNQIANCPITVDDIDRAETIYGPSVQILKGKTTRRTPERVVSDYVNVPLKVLSANKNVSLSGDIFFINKIPFFTTISENIKFTTTELLASRKIKNIHEAISHVKALHDSRGFKIETILMDGEFAPLRNDLASLRIKLNVTAANEHVPQIERQIRVVKERVRAIRHSLPFKYIPMLMLVELVYFSTMWINAFPPKGGVSKNVSPRGIMTGTQFDYTKHCKIPFGSYVQAHEEPDKTNTQGARTVGAICLGPTGNLQGSYKFLNLRSGRLITRRNWTSLPMPDEVIKRVDQLGRNEGQPELLTFFDRRGLVIGDLTLPDANKPDPEDFYDQDEDFPDEAPHIGDGLDPPTTNEDFGLADTELPGAPEPPDTSATQEDYSPVDPVVFQAQADQQAMEMVDSSGPLPDVVDPQIRPQRVRTKPERLIPTFSGKSYQSSSLVNPGVQGVLSVPRDPPKSHMESEVIYPDSHMETHFALLTFYVMTQLSMKSGLKRWKRKGEDAISLELRQLHFRDTFQPLDHKKLTNKEYKECLESHLFLKQKRDDSIKGRMVAGGNKQRGMIPAQEASSPTASLESVLLTATIDASEDRDVCIIDIPNAFVQTRITNETDRAIMRMRGKLAKLLVKVAPKIYTKYVTVNSKGETVLYVKLLNALYGIMKAALLFYQRFVGDLESIGFVLNPYDPCVANKMVDGHQLTIVWHVDDLKISHKSEKTVTRMITWLKRTYERMFDDGSGAMKVCRGKLHDYLGMTIDYRVKGQVTFSMVAYIEEIIRLFSKYDDTTKTASTPAAEHIFRVNNDSPKLPKERLTIFHHFVAKCLFVTKRSRPDIAVAVAFLTTRVKSPDEDDWKKLIRMIRYLRGTPKLALTLSARSATSPKWWVDGSHGVHPTMRGHTGGCMSLGKGMQLSVSSKQKMNSRSSTETEIIAVDDLMPSLHWANYFLEHQGYTSTNTVLYQDNKSAILLEKNGRKSSGKRTKHINMRFYFITDRIRGGELSVEHCPTEEMIADFFTKPLQGKLFFKFRALIMNLKE